MDLEWREEGVAVVWCWLEIEKRMPHFHWWQEDTPRRPILFLETLSVEQPVHSPPNISHSSIRLFCILNDL